MFKIFNPNTKKVEVVAKIDYKKHYHVSGKPFDVQEVVEVEEEAPVEELIVNASPKKKGRPKAN